MTVFPADGPATVRVELQIGRLEVLATAREDVTVHASPSNPDRAGDRSAAEAVQIDKTGDTIVVKGPHTRKLNPFGPGKDSVDVVVEVPEGSHVVAAVKYGNARLAGRLATVEAEAPYGEFSLDSAERLQLKGGYGDFRVTHVDGDAEIDAKYGAVRVGHVGGRLRVTGSGGAITVDRAVGVAELKTANGSIEIGTLQSGASIRTAYGAVRIRDAIRGAIGIDGSYGSVDVGVRAGTAVWLDAHSQQGVVRTDLSSDAGPSTGEETLELRIRTGYGPIDVHRSSI